LSREKKEGNKPGKDRKKMSFHFFICEGKKRICDLPHQKKRGEGNPKATVLLILWEKKKRNPFTHCQGNKK